MATRKKARAKAASKKVAKKKATARKGTTRKGTTRKAATRKAATRKAVARKGVARKGVARKVTVRAAPAKARSLKDRHLPETLRLKSFTPSLTVNDLEKSLAFYSGALGFFVGQRWMDGDVLRGVMLKAGASELGLSQDDWKMGRDRQKGAGSRLFCNTAQDIDAIAARVKAAGFALTAEPEDHTAWGVRTFSVDDPDGFHLTIGRDL